QLALSIDYSIFMIHRYYEERETKEKVEAIKSSVKRSFRPIAISALTTIAGFSALGFMNFLIGKDIAIVLSKGIFFSFLGTMIILPILLYWFDHIIHKLKHKIVMPKLDFMTKIQIKSRYVLLVLFAIVFILGFIFQTKTEYLYGSSNLSDEDTIVADDTAYINHLFGENNQIVVIVPTESLQEEYALISELMNTDHVISVTGLSTMVDPNTPLDYLPGSVTAPFIQGGYSRIIINTDIESENEEMYSFSGKLKEVVRTHYSEYYLVGSATSVTDMRDSITSQGSLIMGLTILFVGFIVGLIFKSWKIPLILLSVITAAIFISLGYLALTDQKVLYIGYIIVMSIQLGATIDYAVLLTNRYLEERVHKNKKEALTIAFQKSSMSILVSGSILTIVGFVEALYSNLSSITSIGYMLGRGTLISLIMILSILPPLLYILDPWIIKHQKHLE
ncbi:MAG: RND family transporter, partial [Candidatus Izemoplasmatales bacterium]